jgi:hypothetical protein
MHTITAMRKLLRVRALQRERLEREVSQKQAALRQAEAQAAQAAQEQARCEAVEAAALRRHRDLVSNEFVASEVESTHLYLGVCARTTALAVAATDKARAVVFQQNAALAAAVALLDRNTDQSEQLRARLADALKQAAELAEEAESDEAGEMAAARISARQRAAATATAP